MSRFSINPNSSVAPAPVLKLKDGEIPVALNGEMVGSGIVIADGEVDFDNNGIKHLSTHSIQFGDTITASTDGISLIVKNVSDEKNLALTGIFYDNSGSDKGISYPWYGEITEHIVQGDSKIICPPKPCVIQGDGSWLVHNYTAISGENVDNVRFEIRLGDYNVDNNCPIIAESCDETEWKKGNGLKLIATQEINIGFTGYFWIEAGKTYTFIAQTYNVANEKNNYVAMLGDGKFPYLRRECQPAERRMLKDSVIRSMSRKERIETQDSIKDDCIIYDITMNLFMRHKMDEDGTEMCSFQWNGAEEPKSMPNLKTARYAGKFNYYSWDDSGKFWKIDGVKTVVTDKLYLGTKRRLLADPPNDPTLFLNGNLQWSAAGGGTPVITNHNDLKGIQGGSTEWNDYYHSDQLVNQETSPNFKSITIGKMNKNNMFRNLGAELQFNNALTAYIPGSETTKNAMHSYIRTSLLDDGSSEPEYDYYGTLVITDNGVTKKQGLDSIKSNFYVTMPGEFGSAGLLSKITISIVNNTGTYIQGAKLRLYDQQARTTTLCEGVLDMGGGMILQGDDVQVICSFVTPYHVKSSVGFDATYIDSEGAIQHIIVNCDETGKPWYKIETRPHEIKTIKETVDTTGIPNYTMKQRLSLPPSEKPYLVFDTDANMLLMYLVDRGKNKETWYQWDGDMVNPWYFENWDIKTPVKTDYSTYWWNTGTELWYVREKKNNTTCIDNHKVTFDDKASQNLFLNKRGQFYEPVNAIDRFPHYTWSQTLKPTSTDFQPHLTFDHGLAFGNTIRTLSATYRNDKDGRYYPVTELEWSVGSTDITVRIGGVGWQDKTVTIYILATATNPEDKVTTLMATEQPAKLGMIDSAIQSVKSIFS